MKPRDIKYAIKHKLHSTQKAEIYKELKRREKSERLAELAETMFFDLIFDETSGTMGEEKEAWQKGDTEEAPKEVDYKKLARKATKIASNFIAVLYKELDKLEPKV